MQCYKLWWIDLVPLLLNLIWFFFLYLCSTQIKWICPTAPSRPVSVFGGFPSTACKFLCYFHVSTCARMLSYPFRKDHYMPEYTCPAMLFLCLQGLMLLIFQRMLLMMLRGWMPQQHMLQICCQLNPLTVWLPSFFSLFLFGDGSHWLFINFIHPSYQTGTRCEIDHIAFAVILWPSFLICSIHLMKLLDFCKRACMFLQKQADLTC